MARKNYSALTQTVDLAEPAAGEPVQYVKAEGGWLNGAALPYRSAYYVDGATRTEVPAEELRPGQPYGVYASEDLGNGRLMRWQGEQVVVQEPDQDSAPDSSQP